MLTLAKQSAAAAVALALGLFASWQLFGWGGPEPTRIAGALGAAGASLVAIGAMVWAACVSRERQRAAWACMAVGLAGWVVADVYRAWVVLDEPWLPLAPSAAELGRLLLPVGVAAATLVLPAPRGTTSFRLLLDGLIVAIALYVVGWVVVLRSLASDEGRPHFVLGLALVVTDVAMIAIAVMILAKSRSGFRTSPALLMSALIVIGLTDAVHVLGSAHGYEGGLLLVGWTTGMCLFILATLTFKLIPSITERSTAEPSRLPLWLPYAPVPVAIVLAIIELRPGYGLNAYLLLPGAVLILATLVRQFTLLHENGRLLQTVAGLALRDSLTGLANRAVFSDQLADAMQIRRAIGGPVAVLLLDVDDFKLVNDSLGHPAGDTLLRGVGERIQRSIRPNDIVARIGGDEFAILVQDTPESAGRVAEYIIDAFSDPIVIEGRPLYVRVSLGLATLSASEDTDISADELLRRADLAMYSAKRANPGGVRAFSSDMHHEPAELHLSRHQRAEQRSGVARVQLLAELRNSIEQRRLELVYQPKFSLVTGSVVGVEGLLRWPHPEYGLLEPGDFLPLIRENGLNDEVTNLVLSMAARDAADWYVAGLNIPVAVNLSTPSLNDDSLPDRVVSVLAQHNLPAEVLTIEITEDVLLASVVRARSVLDRLRQAGVRVAIDDFGSGFATMRYLRELPIDELKLDRQFVTPILHDERSAMIVRSVVELADALGVDSVAEGVENAETADRLREYGCGFVQGHYFSPPVPATAIRLGIWGSKPTDGRISPTA